MAARWRQRQVTPRPDTGDTSGRPWPPPPTVPRSGPERPLAALAALAAPGRPGRLGRPWPPLAPLPAHPGRPASGTSGSAGRIARRGRIDTASERASRRFARPPPRPPVRARAAASAACVRGSPRQPPNASSSRSMRAASASCGASTSRFVSSTARGTRPATAVASSRAVPSSAAGATRRLTRPTASASAASSRRPSRNISIARRRPTRAGRSWLEPASGHSPSGPNGAPKLARDVATTRSACSSAVNPMPIAAPSTAAISGCRSAASACSRRPCGASAPRGAPPRKSSRSLPAQNDSPLASSSTTRGDSARPSASSPGLPPVSPPVSSPVSSPVSPSVSSASASVPYIAAVSALRRAGRSMRSTRTPASSCTCTVPSASVVCDLVTSRLAAPSLASRNGRTGRAICEPCRGRHQRRCQGTRRAATTLRHELLPHLGHSRARSGGR